MPAKLKYDFIKFPLHDYSCKSNYYKMTQYHITIEAFHKQRQHDILSPLNSMQTAKLVDK